MSDHECPTCRWRQWEDTPYAPEDIEKRILKDFRTYAKSVLKGMPGKLDGVSLNKRAKALENELKWATTEVVDDALSALRRKK